MNRPRRGEQRVEIEALFEMIGERIERRFDRRIVLRLALGPEPGQKRMPESVAGEQPVQIAAGDPVIAAHRAVGTAVEAQHWPRESRSGGDPEMHLVAAYR